jgi:hypothetical protein
MGELENGADRAAAVGGQEAQNNPPLPLWRRIRRRTWALIAGVGVILGIVLGVPDVRGYVYRFIPPDVEATFYAIDERGNPSISPDVPYTVIIDDAALEAESIPIPIYLALRNNGRRVLEDVRVTLTFDRQYMVEAGGEPRIDPEGASYIYEHNLGSVHPSDQFTPLGAVDTVQLGIEYIINPLVALSQDDVPAFTVGIIVFPGLSGDVTYELPVEVTLKCKGRPNTEYQLVVRLDAKGQIWLPSDGSEIVDEELTEADSELFAGSSGIAWDVLDSWSGNYTPGDRTVSYMKAVHPNGGIYQLIGVDGVRRRVICDVDADGRAEHDMWDSTGDGIPDTKVSYSPPAQMPDWPRETVR